MVTVTGELIGGTVFVLVNQMSSRSRPGRRLLISASGSVITETIDPSRCARNVPSMTREPLQIHGPRDIGLAVLELKTSASAANDLAPLAFVHVTERVAAGPWRSRAA